MGDGGNKYGPKMRITERGYSIGLARNIAAAENQIRRLPDEQMLIFDSNGNKLGQFQGKGASVIYDKKIIPPDSIITHNHPLSIGKKGILAIGNSFSEEDIQTAIITNAKEIRAVTPTYTFSVKRPKGGWGDMAKAMSDYKRAETDALNEAVEYLGKAKNLKDRDTRLDRAGVLISHKIMKEMRKRYGWEYTKTKG